MKCLSHGWITATASVLAAVLCAPAALNGQTGTGVPYNPPRTAFGHPDLQGIRRLSLTTRDAHGLYEKVGFTRTEFGRFMDKTIPDVYQRR